MDMPTPELKELLRKCLVLGGPLAVHADNIINDEFRHIAYLFLYPHDMQNDPVWLKEYRK